MSQRRAVRPGEPAGPPIENRGHVWFIRDLMAGRRVLRARHQTTQAGFTAESIPRFGPEHRPILISDGPLHDRQRSQVARFFAPAVVEERYLALMEEAAERWLAEASEEGSALLDHVALHYAVDVTAEVVGLSSWREDTVARRRRKVMAMSRRLESFFNQPPFDITRPDLGRTRWQWAQAAFNGLLPVLRFHLADVRPALRQRRRAPGDDVMSHLLGLKWSTPNILVEAVTYGTAGMVTTREFICMAALHLMSSTPLRASYLQADREGRLAILNEIIRLEPVVGHLYRRAVEDIEIDAEGRHHRVERGHLVDVCIRQTNVDPVAVGDEPFQLCPGRTMAPGVNPAGLSFGDGAHRCPGQPLALLETEVFLTRLLGLGPTVVGEPQLGWDELVAGYRLRDVKVSFDRP